MTDNGYFQRYFINFDEDITGLFSENEILKSLLELSRRIAIELQEERFSALHHRFRLDDIKLKAVGLGNAQKDTYDKIANYASYLFAFQQYFHSSYRARQGSVLENVISVGIKLAKLENYKVVEKKKRKSTLISFFGLEKNIKLDMDVVIYSESKKFIMPIQIRSRDDTGGTTAKASNVDYLNEVLKHFLKDQNLESWIEEKKKAVFVILVWEPLDKKQANSMKKKIWQSLEQSLVQFDENINEQDFINHLDEGFKISQSNVTLKTIYGFEEFMNFLSFEFESKEIAEILSRVWKSLENWDDLWLTYTIASLEFPLLSTYGKTNLEIVKNGLKNANIEILEYEPRQIIELSKDWASKIAAHIKEEKFPTIVSNMQERMNYIRDLILVLALKLVATENDYKRLREFHKDFFNTKLNFFVPKDDQ